MALSPNGEYAYVANEASNSVSVIDTATNSLTTTINGLSDLWGIAITHTGAYIYVTNAGSSSVSVNKHNYQYCYSDNNG